VITHRKREQSLLSAIWERQQRIGIGVLWLMLLALAVVISNAAGVIAGILAFVLLAVSLEFLYEWLQAMRARHARAWWSKNRTIIPRLYVFLAASFLSLLINSPVARYTVLISGLLGVVFAIVFRYQRRDGI
jgi:uncharacterized BrkB/YihY/UPF0761 family membrane protein